MGLRLTARTNKLSQRSIGLKRVLVTLPCWPQQPGFGNYDIQKRHKWSPFSVLKTHVSFEIGQLIPYTLRQTVTLLISSSLCGITAEMSCWQTARSTCDWSQLQLSGRFPNRLLPFVLRESDADRPKWDDTLALREGNPCWWCLKGLKRFEFLPFQKYKWESSGRKSDKNRSISESTFIYLAPCNNQLAPKALYIKCK